MGINLDKNIVIGVDLGGTKIMTGAVDINGKLIGESFIVPTGGNDPKEMILERIYLSIDSVLMNNNLNVDNVVGIGIGSTGPLDAKNGIILECPQLPNMHYFPLKKAVQDKYNVPVYMNNDANALILGESIMGAGKGNNIVLGFTLGTGLGCAIVIEGKLLMGATETAGEIWTSPYRRGIIEDVVSGSGVSKIYKKLTNKDLLAKEIADLARSNDNEAINTWTEFGRALAFAMAWSINLIDPDVVILGGSIASAMDIFGETMNSILKKNICSVPASKIKIVLAELGNKAGYIGAACLVPVEKYN
jgi:glucokinase